MKTLKIAIQKSGRLSEKSVDLLKECGIKFSNIDRKLKTISTTRNLNTLLKLIELSA